MSQLQMGENYSYLLNLIRNIANVDVPSDLIKQIKTTIGVTSGDRVKSDIIAPNVI